tara:strand:- start:825 stop:1664 length:840 start_codon:yes stop_codon:yes gene_type:complete
MGVLWCYKYNIKIMFYNIEMRTFTKFIGACCKYGQEKNGVQLGPQTLLNGMGLSADAIYIDDFDYSGYENLYKLHYDYLRRGWKPVTIGGDHSIALSTVASSARVYKDDLTVVWVDAHADIHTPSSSPSQNLHGMPLGSLLDYDTPHSTPHITPGQLIYIGLRDIEPHEEKVINDLGIENYTMEDLKKTPLDEILTNIYNRTDAIHLSFDVDVIDPIYISCTGTPVKDGISYNDAEKIINKLSPKIISADVVEFNPLLGDKKQVLKETDQIIKLLDLLN